MNLSAPSIKGLIKIHKPDQPIRPVVNWRNIPKTKLNSVALVHTRTIPTERLPPVGEVSANFCG